MIRNILIALVIGAGLWACSGAYTVSAESKTALVDPKTELNASIDSIIAPYQDSLSLTMDEVIAYAPEDFTKGRPNAALNNWAADAILLHELNAQALDTVPYQRVMCLLNVGGLRNPISKGPVTVGDIYKLMPFDNEIVWVEMPWKSNVDIAKYLIRSGGEPISNAILTSDSLIIGTLEEPAETFWVITSDYLMNGGDKMDFFDKKIGFDYGTGLMRDAMLREAKRQDTLDFSNDVRIQQ